MPDLYDVEPLPPPAPPATIGDAACVGCGYNLRGLAPTAACPECNASIVRSLELSRINADPAKLPALTIAARRFSLGLWAALVLSLSGIAVLTAASTGSNGANRPALLPVLLLLSLAGVAFATTLWLFAAAARAASRDAVRWPTTAISMSLVIAGACGVVAIGPLLIPAGIARLGIPTAFALVWLVGFLAGIAALSSAIWLTERQSTLLRAHAAEEAAQSAWMLAVASALATAAGIVGTFWLPWFSIMIVGGLAMCGLACARLAAAAAHLARRCRELVGADG